MGNHFPVTSASGWARSVIHAYGYMIRGEATNNDYICVKGLQLAVNDVFGLFIYTIMYMRGSVWET